AFDHPPLHSFPTRRSSDLAPLPQSFWDRSMFVKPRDREVVCHASAWDIDFLEDVRIKMCIQPTSEDFQTIHHELGHNFYQRAYRSEEHTSELQSRSDLVCR